MKFKADIEKRPTNKIPVNNENFICFTIFFKQDPVLLKMTLENLSL